MSRKLRCLIFSLQIIMFQSLWGTVYYVDATHGSDSNGGTSSSTAWRTIAKINNSMAIFQPGDRILFERGENWSDTSLSIRCSGTMGNPIIFDAYATGNKPIVSGGRCIYSDSLIHDVTVRNFHVMNSTDTSIYFSGGGGFRYRINVEYCDVEYAGNCGIYFDQTDTFTIDRCTVSYPGNAAFVIYGSPNYKAANGIISNCTAVDDLTASNDGFTIHTAGSGIEPGPNMYLYNCVAHGWRENGFDSDGGSYVILRNCESYGNGGEGIAEFSYGSEEHVFVENCYFHDGISKGLFFGACDHMVITNSIIYNIPNGAVLDRNGTTRVYFGNDTLIHGPASTSYIIDVYNEGGPNPDYVNIKNCIFTSTQEPGFIHQYRVCTPTSTHSNNNYNCFWDHSNSPAGHFYANGSSFSFSSWQTIFSQEQNSIWQDPKLNGDRTLQPNSPCINAGSWLTTITSSSGSGNQFRVADAKWFHDGFGLTTGSVIQLQSQSVPLTVTDINYATNTITVNQTVSWAQGNGVAFAYSGYAPDIGAREYTGSQPLMADASGSPSSGTAPLVVNFIGSASGGTPPYSYSWDFGDGQSSSTQNPSHTYNSAGSYTATLTVTDNQNTTNRRSIAISATSAPSQLVVSASANPNSGQAPLTVNFTGSGTGGTPPYSYSWNFGDGSTSTTQNPSHAYTATGNFTATLTVTDKNSTNANATVNITVSVTITSYNLLLSSETGAPAPDQGGTTDPSPGNHSYSIGSTVQIEAIPHLDYRFANWSGDANTAKLYDQKIPILMDGNKSIVAHFCTRCGDVNGNLAITPGDAQEAFEIYLGRISNPTECQRENADVNCDGTKSHPNITPADAQAIFKIYLGSIGFPCDCSGKSRAENIVSQIRKTSGIRLILNDIQGQRDREIVVPVLIDSRTKINSFGFDLIYPSETLEFIRTEGIGLSKDFEQVGVNHIANGALRVGGYNIVKKTGLLSGILLTLVFRVIGDINNPRLLSIINTVDDLKNATVQTGMLLKKKDIPKKRDNMDKRIHPGHNYQENS